MLIFGCAAIKSPEIELGVFESGEPTEEAPGAVRAVGVFAVNVEITVGSRHPVKRAARDKGHICDDLFCVALNRAAIHPGDRRREQLHGGRACCGVLRSGAFRP